MDSRDWVPEEAVESLTVRRALTRDEDPVKMAISIIREHVPVATMRMVHLALHSPTETVAFQASKYIMDKAMGDTRDLKISEKPAWEKIFDGVMVEVNSALEGGE